MSCKERRSDYDPREIKEELSKFINLLQGERRESCISKKLSVVMSAGDHESSSMDKENSNPSANRSFDSHRTPALSLVKALLNTPLNPAQVKMLDQLRVSVDEMQSELDSRAAIISELQEQLNAQKKGTDELIAVLMRLEEEDKQLWGSYNSLGDKYKEVRECKNLLEQQIEVLKRKIVALQNDNQFMKKLIFHANENYEQLEKRCGQLERMNRSINKSSADDLLRSATTKKNSHSPSYSEVQHSPGKNDFSDVYRKMIVRTLKSKGKKDTAR